MFKVLLVYIFLSCFLILLVDAEKAITINLSFKQEKYITSVEMGKRCLAWLIENIDLFTGFSLDQEYYLQLKACEICNLVADLEGRTFDENDFHSSLYPHVKKNALTMSYDKFPTGKCNVHLTSTSKILS